MSSTVAADGPGSSSSSASSAASSCFGRSAARPQDCLVVAQPAGALHLALEIGPFELIPSVSWGDRGALLGPQRVDGEVQRVVGLEPAQDDARERSRVRVGAHVGRDGAGVRGGVGLLLGRHALRRGELRERREHLVVVRLRRGLRDHVARSTPSASMMNVERRAPQYVLPYIDFSPQTPYALADRVVLVGEQREVQPLLVVELLDGLDRVGRDAEHASRRRPS